MTAPCQPAVGADSCQAGCCGHLEEGDPGGGHLLPQDTGQHDRPEDRGAGGAQLPGCQARMSGSPPPVQVTPTSPFVLDSPHGTPAASQHARPWHQERSDAAERDAALVDRMSPWRPMAESRTVAKTFCRTMPNMMESITQNMMQSITQNIGCDTMPT